MGDEDMRYASVCDGIGAVHVAWQPLGWECMWTSEIDPFPSEVVEQRWGFENRGDMTKYEEWPVNEESSIDLLVGGTPCQSFSVAGLRQGLKDPRGNLMLTYLAIAERLKPRWVVWENVPGVLSSNGGKDFGSFLGALADLGYGWAYRVLDAQWFGVAQRRRRVFVVGCFGDATSASKVLFESESVQRNPAPSRTAREKTSGPIAGCSNGGGANGPGRTADDADSLVVAHVPVMVMAHGQANAEICEGYSPTLSCAHEVPIAFAQNTRDEGQTAVISFHPTQDPISNEDGIVHALGTESPAVAIRTAQTSANGHGIAEDVCHTIDRAQGQAVAFAQNTRDEVRMINGDGQIVGALAAQPGMKQTTYIAFTAKGSGADAGTLCPTIRAGGHSKSHANGGVMPAVAFAQNQAGEVRTNSDVMGTINTNQNASGRNTPMVMFNAAAFIVNNSAKARSDAFTIEGTPTLRGLGSVPAVAHTLKGRGFNGSEDGTGRGTPLVPVAMAVRRLTPRECERLQGFPDFYTAITYRKKPAADGPRYKALGNSMAVPCMRWIGERIETVET